MAIFSESDLEALVALFEDTQREHDSCANVSACRRCSALLALPERAAELLKAIRGLQRYYLVSQRCLADVEANTSLVAQEFAVNHRSGREAARQILFRLRESIAEKVMQGPVEEASNG